MKQLKYFYNNKKKKLTQVQRDPQRLCDVKELHVYNRSHNLYMAKLFVPESENGMHLYFFRCPEFGGLKQFFVVPAWDFDRCFGLLENFKGI